MLEITDSEKFAAIALPEPWLGDDVPELIEVAPSLWVARESPFVVDDFWRSTIGSLKAEQLDEAKLFLITKATSSAPQILDSENKKLGNDVWLLYLGVLLTGFMHCGTPVRLTGARRADGLDVRSIGDIEEPRHTLGTPLETTTLDSARLRLAAQVAESLTSLLSRPKIPRISKILHAFYAGINENDAAERLHQFARCVEGFIVPRQGATAKQFKHRSELFVGPRHHADMGEIYDIRSAVEHLHGAYAKIQRPSERELRLALLQRAVQIEAVARYCLRTFLLNQQLWPLFQDDTAAAAFWDLPEPDRRSLWGAALDFPAVVQTFESRYIEDHELGLP
jgi:hypothetical protein